MDKDDWIFLIAGIIVGGIGILIYKTFIEKSLATSSGTQVVWGANYAYDSQNRLIQYMPVPLPIGGQVQTVQMPQPQPQQTQETAIAKTTLF